MKFKLGLRQITESDINIACKFMPDEEDYRMHVAAFVEDLNSLDIVNSAYENSDSVIIELNDDVSIEQLKQASIPIIQFYWTKLRQTGLEKCS